MLEKSSGLTLQEIHYKIGDLMRDKKEGTIQTKLDSRMGRPFTFERRRITDVLAALGYKGPFLSHDALLRAAVDALCSPNLTAGQVMRLLDAYDFDYGEADKSVVLPGIQALLRISASSAGSKWSKPSKCKIP